MSNPFKIDSKPGSSWDKDQLEWLGVDFEAGHQAVDLIPDGRVIEDRSKIHKLLTRYLDLPWSKVIDEDPEKEFDLFYESLKLLGRKRSSVHVPRVWESSTPSGPASTPRNQIKRSIPIGDIPSDHQTKRLRSPGSGDKNDEMHHSQGARLSVSSPLSPGLGPTRTPKIKVEDSSHKEVSPLDHRTKRHRALDHLMSSSPPSIDGEDESSITLPPLFLPRREVITNAEDNPGNVLKNPAVDVTPPSSPFTPLALPVPSSFSPYLPSRSSDVSYRPSSPPQAQLDGPDLSRSSQEDKSEGDAAAAARIFLLIVQRVIWEVEKEIQVAVE